jgi:hypothetical protein
MAVLENPDFIIEHPLQFAPAPADPGLPAAVQAEAMRNGVPQLTLGDEPEQVLCALGSLSGRLAYINIMLTQIENPYAHNLTSTRTTNEAISRVVQQALLCWDRLQRHIAGPLANLLRELLVFE